MDGPAPLTMERFLALCSEQLSGSVAASIAAIVGGNDAEAVRWSPATAWRELDALLRNRIAEERARALGADSSKWLHPVEGCSIYWAGRISSAFQERDPARRDRLLDQVRWDAAGDLVPPGNPLSAEAALAYAVRLEIVIRRAARSNEAGGMEFDRQISRLNIKY